MLAWMMETRPGTLPRQLSNPALDAIVRRCMRVLPAERYASADELLADLRESSPRKRPAPSVAVRPIKRPFGGGSSIRAS